MGKIKLLLDVVEDMETLGQRLKAAADSFCHLAHSVKTVAQAFRENEPKKEALPAPAAPKKEKPLTDADVRAVLQPRIPLIGRETVQELIRKYGAPKLTEVDHSKYPALVAEAKAMVSDEELEAYLAEQEEIRRKQNAT